MELWVDKGILHIRDVDGTHWEIVSLDKNALALIMGGRFGTLDTD